MSLRSLGYLITRRFSPRNIYSVHAGSSPGIVSQAASVSAACRSRRSLHTLRYFGSTGHNAYYGALVAAALAGGLGILIFKKHHDEAAGSNVTNEDTKEVSLKPEVTENKPMQVEVTDIEKRDVDMEAMFRDWMKRVGKVYPNQEEERKRFEVFKERVKRDPLYVPKSDLADRTPEEVRVIRRVEADEELEAFRRLYEERKRKLKEQGTSTTA